jgi:thymidylate kinase
VLITFSGLDGAGKSTLIERLKTSLENQNKRVTVFHMNDHVGVYAYLRALRDWIKRSPSSSNGPPIIEEPAADLSGRVSTQSAGRRRFASLLAGIRNLFLWNRPIRRCLYPVDLLFFLCYRLYVEKIKKQVLIMDRYFYDTLVDVSDGKNWRCVRLLWLITPRPSLPVFLDISPEESYARKGEYSVEYLRRRWVAYQKVFTWTGPSVVLTNEDLNKAARALEKIVSERMATG